MRATRRRAIRRRHVAAHARGRVAADATRATTDQPGLAVGAIGQVGQIFQSITHMAPAAAIVFSAQYMATQGGGSLALGWLLASVACMLTALCLAEVVRKVHGAGGYFVLHSVAFGSFVGFSTGW